MTKGRIAPAAIARFTVSHAMHLAFAGMTLYFAVSTSGFASTENLLNVLNQNFAYLILGTGMTLVILAGGIDLSVGSLVAMCGVIATSVLVRGGVALTDGGDIVRLFPVGAGLGLLAVGGVVLALVSGAGVGAINGWMVTRLGVPPFIATLAWFMTARGLAYKLCAARPIGDLPASFVWLGQGRLGAVRFPVLVALGLAVLMHVVLTRTVFGRHVVAVGSNVEAARLSGIQVRRVQLYVYALNGLMAGLCGILLAARLQAGDPKVGTQPPLELGAITAAVLGGASLSGGKGSIAGTVFGALFMGILDNGLALQGMQYFDQLVVKGIVLLVAVVFDQLKGRRALS
jgi:ribose/xylose/arabinose/galactoside ABC-type transport system permease subunit